MIKAFGRMDLVRVYLQITKTAKDAFNSDNKTLHGQIFEPAAHCRAISNCIQISLSQPDFDSHAGVPARLSCTIKLGVEHHLPQCLAQ